MCFLCRDLQAIAEPGSVCAKKNVVLTEWEKGGCNCEFMCWAWCSAGIAYIGGFWHMGSRRCIHLKNKLMVDVVGYMSV